MSGKTTNTIKEARLRAGLTQQALSDLLGIAKRTIEDWDSERRRPPAWVEKLLLEKLEQIAAAKEDPDGHDA